MFLFAMIVFISLLPMVSAAGTLNVGSGQTYSTISAAMAAAGSGDTIHVHSGTYTVATTVLMKGGVTLYGDGYGNTIIYSGPATNFDSASNPAMIWVNNADNTNIYGFTFKGPATGLADIHVTGHGGADDYHNAIKISSSSYSNIHDCYFTLLYSDGVRGDGGASDHINVYNNQFLTTGHDAVQIWSGNYWTVHNNICNMMINSFVRVAPATNTRVYYNTIYCETKSGYTGIEYENSGNSNITVDHNIFEHVESSVGIGVAGYVKGDETGKGTSTVSNNVFWDCPGGYIVPGQMTLTDTGNIKGTSNTNVSYWVSQGYGYGNEGIPNSVNLPVYNGTPIPRIEYPVNLSAITTQNGYLTSTISNVNSTAYLINVYNSTTVFDGTTLVYAGQVQASNTFKIPLTNGTYTEMASARDDVHNAGVAASNSPLQFTVTGDVYIPDAGVGGKIYDTSSNSPLQGAIVYITNNSWSASSVTLADGIYQFTGLVSGTYYLSVYCYNYNPSPVLPITLNGTSVGENIALQKVQTYYQPNYVRFVATDPTYNDRYAGVPVYIWDPQTSLDDAPTLTATTDGTGTASFQLLQTTNYVIQSTYLGNTQESSLMPIDNFYYITFPKNTIAYTVPASVGISFNVTKNQIDSTTANVNYSLLDTTTGAGGASSYALLTLSEVNGTGNSTFVNSHQLTAGELITLNSGNYVNGSFVVTVYLGKSYSVKSQITHSLYGNDERIKYINFPGNYIPLLSYIGFAYLALVLLFIIGMQFGTREHASGAVILCITTWVFLGIGMYDSLGADTVARMWDGTWSATAYAVLTLLAESQNPQGM